MPGDTEDLYEDILEDVSRLKTLTSRQAGWMTVFLKHKCEQEHEQLGTDIENELGVSSSANQSDLPIDVQLTGRMPRASSSQLPRVAGSRRSNRPEAVDEDSSAHRLGRLTDRRRCIGGGFACASKSHSPNSSLRSSTLLTRNTQISNLFPQQPRSWGSPNEPDSEIFLTTRKNSRIQKMPKLL